MKRAFLISLLALMLLQAFSKVFIVLDYQLNKEYIMEFLCLNREKPEMRCEGQCHLTKQLQKSEQADRQASEKSGKQELPITLYCQDLFRLNPFNTNHAPSPETWYRLGHPRTAMHAIFHPPRFTV